MRNWLFVLALAAGIGAILGTAFALHRAQAAPTALPDLRAQVTWHPGAKRAPQLALRDQTGSAVSLAAQRGHVVLVTFLDSRCHSECPIEGRALASVLGSFPAARKPTLLVVSVDPWGDSRASANAFILKSGWSGDVHWLLGTRAQLAPLWRAYSVAVRRTPRDIVHSMALYVVDRQGYLRAGYLFPFAPRVVAHDVNAIRAS